MTASILWRNLSFRLRRWRRTLYKVTKILWRRKVVHSTPRQDRVFNNRSLNQGIQFILTGVWIQIFKFFFHDCTEMGRRESKNWKTRIKEDGKTRSITNSTKIENKKWWSCYEVQIRRFTGGYARIIVKQNPRFVCLLTCNRKDYLHRTGRGVKN